MDGQPKITKKDDLPAIEEEDLPNESSNIEDRKSLNKEVFLNDQKIIELIWRYLRIDDKFNCTLVCKRFNRIISLMDCFCLSYSPSLLRVIPKLSRDYKNAIFMGMQCSNLKVHERAMLKHLGKSLINLKIYELSTNREELCALLREVPLLESLSLNMTLETEPCLEELSMKDVPKLLHLKFLKISMSDENLNGALTIFDSAPIIESLSLFHVYLRLNELNHFLRGHKSYLRCLTLRYCGLCSDHNYKNSIFTPNDFKIFDELHQLRELYLLYFGCPTLRILNSKCINWLTDLVVVYRYEHNKRMNTFYVNYLLLKEIDEVQLSEYDASKGPIVVKSQSPISDEVSKTYYHVHHCAFDSTISKYDHLDCVEMPLSNKELHWIDVFGEHLCLYIQVREDAKEFRDLKEKIQCVEYD
ncbi:unnamed protein product [Diamesa tonsa]